MRFLAYIAIYLGNSKRWAHGYYGMLIGSHGCQIEWLSFSMTLHDP